MSTAVTRAGLEPYLRDFGAQRYFELSEAIGDRRFRDFGPNVLMAIAWKESGFRNVIGLNRDPQDPFIITSRDKGVFQINDGVHRGFLDGTDGCAEGEWKPDGTGRTAYAHDLVPMLAPATYFAQGLLKGAHDFGVANMVKAGDLVKFTVSAYNAGNSGALRGYREGNSDKYTTGGDYATDVLHVRLPILRDVLVDWGWH